MRQPYTTLALGSIAVIYCIAAGCATPIEIPFSDGGMADAPNNVRDGGISASADGGPLDTGAAPDSSSTLYDSGVTPPPPDDDGWNYDGDAMLPDADGPIDGAPDADGGVGTDGAGDAADTGAPADGTPADGPLPDVGATDAMTATDAVVAND